MAWHWQALMGLPRTRVSSSTVGATSLAYAEWKFSLWKGRAHHWHNRARHYMVRRASDFRSTVNHWLQVMGKDPVRELADASNIEAQFNLWRRLNKQVLARIRRMVDLPDWQCIHNGEATWTADTGNGYYGGLQMDRDFMRSYGAYLLRTKGTANHWTPLEQMVVAQIAHNSGRGFYPWPNTARNCELIP